MKNIKNKVYFFQVKYSDIFYFRSICKYCKSEPSFIFSAVENKPDIKILLSRIKNTINFNINNYNFNNILKNMLKYRQFSSNIFSATDIKYNTSIIIPNSKMIKDIEISGYSILECKCNFSHRIVSFSKNKEITNRKSQKVLKLKKNI